MADAVSSKRDLTEPPRRMPAVLAAIAAIVVFAGAVSACTVATVSETKTATSPELRRSRPILESASGGARGRLGWVSRTVGRSVKGRPIVVVSFGSGPRRVLFVGGVHGDEFGTDVANELVAYLKTHPAAVPVGSTIDIVPCANPDGFAAGRRTNARGVDINRNFPTGWRRSTVYGLALAGSRPASEPETRALIALLAARRYTRVVALHSAGGLIDFDGPGGLTLADRIGRAAGLPVVHLATLRGYTGSMGDYVPAKYGIPNITWELKGRSLTPPVLAGLLTAMQP